MEIHLKNIGMIEDSTILLQGLTVVTGDNQTGKTTVGKALYGVCRGLVGLERSYLEERSAFILDRMRGFRGKANLFRFIYKNHYLDFKDFLENYHHFSFLFQSFTLPFDEEEQENLIQGIWEDSKEIYTFLTSEEGIKQAETLISYGSVKMHRDTKHILKELSLITQGCQKLMDELHQQSDLNAYRRTRVEKFLQSEFRGQVQRLQCNEDESEIRISSEEGSDFSVKLRENQVIQSNDQDTLDWDVASDICFIDNPFLMDRFGKRFPHFFNAQHKVENTAVFHEEHLLNLLCNELPLSVFESMELAEQKKALWELLQKVIPGDFESDLSGSFYTQGREKIKVGNLATGSKLFAILKILLEKGFFKNDTILILDEPEAHLHPKWQNIFAEMIVLLVKTMGIRVLLTSHSPQFVLAVDANMRKHQIQEQSHFYQTKMTGENTATYVCVDDDLGVIYAQFTKYLSEMKALRDEYTED